MALSPQRLQAKEQVMGGEPRGAGGRAVGQHGSRGEPGWQLRTADVLTKGGRPSGSEAGSQSRDARSVGY